MSTQNNSNVEFKLQEVADRVHGLRLEQWPSDDIVGHSYK